MAGSGPAPKQTRRNRTKLVRGDYKAVPGEGWQHGDIPDAPDGLVEASRVAWATWMRAWFAAHWTPDDLPGLRHVVRLYDQVERGEFQRASELRLSMDTYGITPKGQQDRRWVRPKADEQPKQSAGPATPKTSRYAHLRAVG